MKRNVKNTIFDNSNNAIPGKDKGKNTGVVAGVPGITLYQEEKPQTHMMQP